MLTYMKEVVSGIFIFYFLLFKTDQCKTVEIAGQCGLTAGLKRSSCSTVTAVNYVIAPSSVNTVDLHGEFLLCSTSTVLVLLKLKVLKIVLKYN